MQPMSHQKNIFKYGTFAIILQNKTVWHCLKKLWKIWNCGRVKAKCNWNLNDVHYILYSGLLLHPMRECSLKFKFPQIFLSMSIGWGFYPVSTIQHWYARILANKYLHGTPGACISLISLPNTCLRNSKTFRAFSFCFLQLKIKITRAPITIWCLIISEVSTNCSTVLWTFSLSYVLYSVQCSVYENVFQNIK